MDDLRDSRSDVEQAVAALRVLRAARAEAVDELGSAGGRVPWTPASTSWRQRPATSGAAHRPSLPQTWPLAQSPGDEQLTVQSRTDGE
ncbi:MAG: hypothetical protein E6J90_24980 [Deltaproteobacteria bacterium]|nr:MAG: hypothetical protein E6J90_24980 [Deltaproteobacteria bacterium]